MNFYQHFVIAALVSFGMSASFWYLFGVFDLTGFFVISTACALVGSLAGWVPEKGIAVTIGVTVVVRGLAFLAIAGLPPY
ncbi:hypothetical protein DDZ18_09640 [Marinicauda salina]|jgi:hypothetical protein|uniref:Uncharacterized protein n=1 Tax=Marinicauda salina TaxID=2135793 RepID=A0A2U2BSH0_9PROT|nr:hypothetical protein [Marinicauda salina]PWE16961.1 hypothetical protein DDZ18_09640 [Marinicauda salina]